MKIAILFLTLLFVVTVGAQEGFVPDDYGRISNPVFLKLIREQQYQLVGSFVTVSEKPLLQYAKFVKDDKFGFIDLQGNEVIAPRFAMLVDFKDGLSRAAVNVIPQTDTNNESNPTAEYFYIDLYGNEISRHYEYAEFYHSGVAIVRNSEKWGLIDHKGSELVRPQYDEIIIYNDFYLARSEKKWGMISRSGIPLTGLIYDKLTAINGFLLAYNETHFVLLNIKTGKPLDRTVYEATNTTGSIRKGPVGYPLKMNGKALIVKKSGKTFLVNPKGKRISNNYKNITQISENYFHAVDHWKLGLLDSTGKPVFNTVCNDIGISNDEQTFFLTQDNVLKTYNKDYQEMMVPDNFVMGGFRDGMAPIWNDGKVGFINSQGKIIVPIEYAAYEEWLTGNGQIIVKKDHKYGVIDRQGKVIIPWKYDGITYGGPDTYTFMSEGKYGIVGNEGKIIAERVYDSIRYCSDNFYRMSLKGAHGIIKSDGNIIVPAIYDDIGGYKDNYFIARKNGLFGYVNLKGEVVVPVKHKECASWFRNGLLSFKHGNGFSYADCYGNNYPITLQTLYTDYYFRQ